MRSTWMDGLAGIVSFSGFSGTARRKRPDKSDRDPQTGPSGNSFSQQRTRSQLANLTSTANRLLGPQQGQISSKVKNGPPRKKSLPKADFRVILAVYASVWIVIRERFLKCLVQDLVLLGIELKRDFFVQPRAIAVRILSFSVRQG